MVLHDIKDENDLIFSTLSIVTATVLIIFIYKTYFLPPFFDIKYILFIYPRNSYK